MKSSYQNVHKRSGFVQVSFLSQQSKWALVDFVNGVNPTLKRISFPWRGIKIRKTMSLTRLITAPKVLELTNIPLTIWHFMLFTNQNDLESLAFSAIFQVVSCTRTINLRTQTKAFTSIKKKLNSKGNSCMVNWTIIWAIAAELMFC